MHQCEAMWMSFGESHPDKSYAVKVSAGGFNVLNGLPRDATSNGKQDYLAVKTNGSGQM